MALLHNVQLRLRGGYGKLFSLMADKILGVSGCADKILGVHQQKDKILAVTPPISGEPCALCGEIPTPAKVSITIADLTLCSDCYYDPSNNKWVKYTIIGEINKTWIVPQEITMNTCTWFYSTDIPIIRISTYNNSQCNELDSFVDRGIFIWLQRTIWGGDLYIGAQPIPPSVGIFSHEYYTPTSGCLGVIGLWNMLTCYGIGYGSDSGNIDIADL